MEAEGSSPSEGATGAQEQALDSSHGLSDYGLSVNGLSVNGLSVNGLSVNGLSVNGLSVNGLSSPLFQSWFAADPATRDMVMRYVVLCAVPEGQVRTYTNVLTGQTYTWQGLLGLAPTWSQGLLATVAEQQVVTACLAAHANKFGIHLPISILGQSAQGVPIPSTAEELSTYSEREACFFGNVFTDEGVFAATDRALLQASESTPRACGLSSQQEGSDCPPIVHVGPCITYCTLDPTRTYYTQCTYNGVSYRPITTRIRPTDIYSCGDGVCQFTESCGSAGTYDSCFADCGACP